MDDTRIVELYWRRDEQAIHETAEKYGAYCMKISLNILADASDSEENVNDTYIQAWNAMPPHRPQRLVAFLGKLTRNLALNKYKAKHRQKRVNSEFTVSLDELDGCTPSGISVEDEVGIAALGRVISAFLSGEEESVRKVFVCRYFFAEPVKEIAEHFGFTQSKVKTMLMRTRTRLREHLAKEGYDA